MKEILLVKRNAPSLFSSTNYNEDGTLSVSVKGTIEGGISGAVNESFFTKEQATEFAKNALLNSKALAFKYNATTGPPKPQLPSKRPAPDPAIVSLIGVSNNLMCGLSKR